MIFLNWIFGLKKKTTGGGGEEKTNFLVEEQPGITYLGKRIWKNYSYLLFHAFVHQQFYS